MSEWQIATRYWQVSWLSSKSLPSRLLSGFDRLFIMRITVAGTAQDSHLIPFSCTDETPVHHQFGCKDTHYFINMQLFLKKKFLGALEVLRGVKFVGEIVGSVDHAEGMALGDESLEGALVEDVDEAFF